MGGSVASGARKGSKQVVDDLTSYNGKESVYSESHQGLDELSDTSALNTEEKDDQFFENQVVRSSGIFVKN